MKLSAQNFSGKDVRVALSPENEAEKAYLAAFLKHMREIGAEVGEWSNPDEGWGITIVSHVRPA